jgi:hypothetical protein
MNRLAVDADRVLVDYPELRPYFFDDRRAVEVGTERDRVLAASVYFLDSLDAIWDQSRELDQGDRDAWREWIHDLFQGAPTMQDFYLAHLPSYVTLTGMLRNDGCTLPQQHRWAIQQSQNSSGQAGASES